METRTKIIIATIAIALSFAVGRYTSPEKIKTEIKTVEVEKVVTKVVHQVVTVIEKPDGTKETTTVTDARSDSKTNSTSTNELKEITISKDRINVSVLAGSSFPLNLNSPIYGVSASKSLIGPVSVGIWGLSSKEVGLSLGLNF
jgi:hypothetical protein